MTLVCDATAAFSHDHLHATHVLNGPTFAHAILTTQEIAGGATAGGPLTRLVPPSTEITQEQTHGLPNNQSDDE